MSDEQFILILAKALVAAAWADGDLTEDEINNTKDLLYRIPQLTARQWASIEIYIDAPVGEAERARLLAELQEAVHTPENRQIALEALEAMLVADGDPTPEEQQAADEFRAAIQSTQAGLGGSLSRMLHGMTGRRSEAMAGAPNREDYFEDYLQNKVYYGLRRRLDEGEAELDLDDAGLRKLSLAGGLMAQLAQVNPEVTAEERAVVADALQVHWGLVPAEADFVADVAFSETASLLDRTRLVRQFADVTDEEERIRFLDVLFAIAAADGMASYREIEVIRYAATALKLPHDVFIEAKLKIPRSQRAQ